MKKVFGLAIMIMIGLSSVNGQKAKVTYEPKGKWHFEAPDAPEGFTSGTMEVSAAEKKLTAVMTFTGNESKIPLENVKFENDKLKCSLAIEGESISITLKFDEADKMSGTAAFSEGEFPGTMTREKKK